MSEWAMLEIYCFCYYVSKFMAFSAQKNIKVFQASNWNPKNLLFQPLAAAEGYSPDAYVTSDEVVTARPSPSMIYLNMVRWVSSAFQPCNGLSAGHGGSGFESPNFSFFLFLLSSSVEWLWSVPLKRCISSSDDVKVIKAQPAYVDQLQAFMIREVWK